MLLSLCFSHYAFVAMLLLLCFSHYAFISMRWLHSKMSILLKFIATKLCVLDLIFGKVEDFVETNFDGIFFECEVERLGLYTKDTTG